MNEPDRRDEELARLRREVALARFYLERFADPHSFVWENSEKPPHELAGEALKEMDEQRAWLEPADDREAVEGRFPVGTLQMPRLTGGRAGFVEFHQLLARQALDVGRVGAARAALRVLRTTDFSNEAQVAEMLLAVIRDSRSTDEEIAEAILRLTRLEPMPARRRPK